MKKYKTFLFVLLLCSIAQINAQSFNIFELDTMNYPIMKAKFYVFDSDGKQIRDFDKTDFQVLENGSEREIKTIHCPAPPEKIDISSVLVFDVSGSMVGKNIELAREAGRAWINALPDSNSECAITGFDNKNYLYQDFTNDQTLLHSALYKLNPYRGGTDYNQGFLFQLAGGLQIAKKGKHQKVIIFLTDGEAEQPKIEEIINLANELDCKIFSVTFGLKCPESLKQISKKTGGNYFDKITTSKQAKDVLNQINSIANESESCEIEWISKSCESLVDLTIKNKTYKLLQNRLFRVEKAKTVHLNFEPRILSLFNFPLGIQKDTSITLTAKNAEFNIIGIENSNSEFQISPTTFVIENNDSIEINIIYTPIDSNFKYTNLKFINDNCDESISVLSGIKQSKTYTKKTLEVVRPNGGEIFVAGSDTSVYWKGISKNDDVEIEFSSNAGKNWNLISASANSLKADWEVPILQTDSALVRIVQKHIDGDKEGDTLWHTSYNSGLGDLINDVKLLDDKNFILAGHTNSDDDFADGFVMKIDSLGNILWHKSFGEDRDDHFKSIVQTSDGNLIAVGASYTYNEKLEKESFDFWAVKLDNEGNKIWEKWYGGSKSDYADKIIETYDNNFIICGSSKSKDGDILQNYGSHDACIIKINPEGSLIWGKTFGGSDPDYYYGVSQTNDGDILLSGITWSNDFNQKNNGIYEGALFIMKLDLSGEMLWSKLYHDNDETYIRAYTILNNNESEDFYITGEKHLETIYFSNGLQIINVGYMMKCNKNGEKLWEKLYPRDAIVSIESSKLFSNGDILHGGYKYSDGKGTQAVAFKTDSFGKIKWYGEYGDEGRDYVLSVDIHNDSDLIIAGFVGVWNNYVNTSTYRIKGENAIFQSDVSDSTFSIVKPIPNATDIDMGNVILGSSKDSVVSNFIINEGKYPFKVDSIWFDVENEESFRLVSGIPPFVVDTAINVEFNFKPQFLGEIKSKIYIKTQTDTLIKNIRGLAVKRIFYVIKRNIDFNSVYVGESKDSLINNIIYNNSTKNLTIDSIVFLGPNDFDFTFDDDFIPYNFELESKSNLDIKLKFKPSFTGRTSGRLAFYYENQIEPLEVSLFGEGINQPSPYDTCYYNFTYKLPQDSINLNLNNNAKFIDNTIQLTSKKMGQKGSAWFKNKVGIKNGFVTEFTFKFTDGNNYKIIDGSLPGADGIAFVIQANDSLNSGGIGGDIGFAGIPNSLAIEIDTYKNFAKGYEDPNGNHIAVFCNGTDFNKADHKSKALLGETSDIPIIHQDTIYKCKISYKNKQLYIFLNKENEEENLVLNIDVNIPDKIILNDYFEAFVGLTSATGNSVETHNILSWEFCSAETEFNVSNYKKFNESNIIYPNPNNGKFSINLEKINSPVRELFIYDPQGKIEYYYKMQNHFQKELKIDLKLTPSSYFIKIIADDNNYYSKFIIN